VENNNKVKLVGMVQKTNHICYITKQHSMFLRKLAKRNNTSKLSFVEQLLGMKLREKEDITRARNYILSKGYKTIGDWLEEKLDEIEEDGSWKESYQK